MHLFMANVGSIKIREVWSENLDHEFRLIRSIIRKFCFVAMDTEFPGVVFRKVHGNLYTNQVSSAVHYSLLKQNVDALKIIQLGLTFVDSNGNLPDLGDPKYRYIWQFNFRDFDVANDYHAPDSIALLRTTGINFELNRKNGVDTVKFAELMMSSGLVCNGDDITWVTFHCAYDFAYLFKVLTQVPLPSKLSTFLKLLKVFFGSRMFDVKYMIKFCDGLYGGLDRVAQLIEVDRMVGQSHQAGSDSLLTWLVFQKITEAYFSEDGIDKYNGMLYGIIHGYESFGENK
ncbi:probable CCR4-associated factor 1 homolog 11 isoform X2 [Amaranthus tricolor]|uniref:probable CCR4-associated factor 1 homolog 11 isoform X2 n=1 Tax=Amaranthus tricolor TaxID=29722 RepID=UPI00258B3367|nr:probable CCR4-associated factor 1 homolog 11 isoform X2 [Amaranthus tricolor]XP_057536155.1 probable CCR4-associated factor 1 homolog 11 isoform X2 [Amaranthus tricolor]XP_057536157.1 probable CCR4-associated factor 1 homolog 11 isoform X2 [Amaranthus tricolor]XP_057536158.1 probable CCR4-associated factor 1 homolog 11 isoform X2 [Amaranthus tricolor]